MSVSESLKAVISGKDDLSKKLSGIADSADDVSDSMEEAAGAAEVFAGALSEVEDEADDAERNIDSLIRSVNESTAAFSAGVPAAEAYAEAIDDIDSDALENLEGHEATERLKTIVSAEVDEESFEKAYAAVEALPDEKVVTVKGEGEGLQEAAEGAQEVDSDGRPFTLGPQVEGLLSGRLFAPDISLFGDMSGIQAPWQDAPTPDIPEGMGVGDVPDDITVPVKFEPEGMAQVKATAAALERTTDIDIPVSPDLSLDDASTEVDGADSWRANVRDSLESVLSRMDDIDIGEKLLPDLSGRDGSWDISLPDLGDMDWPSKPPPIPVELDIDRSSIPSIGGGDGFDLDFDLRASSLIPDLPDIDLPDMGRGVKTVTQGISEAVSGLSMFGRIGARILPMVGRLATKAGGAFASMASSIGTLPSLGVVLGGGLAIAGVGIIAALGTIVGAIGAIIAAIGGLVTAIAGLGAALAGIIGMGLIKKGEQFAATSEKIEGTMEGIQAYLKSLKPLVEAAIKPLRSLPTGNFLDGLIRGGISALADFSQMVKQLFPGISGMFSRLGEIWSANQPEFFAELEATIRAFLPMLEGFIGWFISAAPDALATMRSMGTKLLPKIADMFGSIGDAVIAWMPAGASFVSMAVEIVTWLAEIAEGFGLLMGPSLVAIFEGLAFVFGLLADATKITTKYMKKGTQMIMKFARALWNAIVNLDVQRFGAILRNSVLGVLGMITKGFKVGLNSLYKMVLGMIKKIPGAKTALKALNAGSKALGGGKAVPNTLLGGRNGKGGGMFQQLKKDLNPKKPGRQTAIGQSPGNNPAAPQGPYQGQGDTNVTFNAGGDIASPRAMEKKVDKAMRRAKRYDRRRSSPHN